MADIHVTHSSPSDAAYALQRAVYDHLLTSDSVKSAIGDPPRMFDVPPRRPIYPFATFNDWRISPVSGVAGGFIHEFRLRVFARQQGRAEARAAMAALYDALQDAPISVDGHTLVSLRFVFSDVFPRGDGSSWSGVSRFRAVTQAIPI